MSWPVWTLLPSVLVFFAVLSWWMTEPKSLHANLIVSLGFVFFCWVVAPDFTRAASASLRAFCMTAVATLELDRVDPSNVSMIVTGAAAAWFVTPAPRASPLRFRSLISWPLSLCAGCCDGPSRRSGSRFPSSSASSASKSPCPPDVSLTAIGVDKATVTWTRPPPNRPVHKFVIQVNGVNGE